MPPSLSVEWEDSLVQTRYKGIDSIKFCYLLTVHYETPVPLDLVPSGIFDAPTGQMTLAESPDMVIRKAADYIRSMAFFAIDPDADDCVDRLVVRSLKNATTRPLMYR